MHRRTVATATAGAASQSPDPPQPRPTSRRYSPAPFRPAAYDDWLTTVPEGLSVSPGLPPPGGDVERSDTAVAGCCAELGEESVRIVETYETDGLVNAGATWWLLARVGDAVLVTATGGEHLPGPALRKGIRQHARQLAPRAEAMCVFSARRSGG